MPFRAKYSDAQREAVVRAVVDYGLSAAHATRLANRGELPGASDDVGAFAIGPYYVGDLVRREKQRRATQERASSSPEEIMRETLGVLAERLDHEVRKLQRQRRRKTTGEEISALARAGKDVAALARAVNGLPQPSTAKPKTNGNGDGESGGFLDALAAGESNGA
jgi:hypothetical protein